MDALSPPARTWLFVPATRTERFAKAAASGADRVILDLEDAVAPEEKVRARGLLEGAALPAGAPVYLRINGRGTEWFDGDLALAARLPLAGVLLPKVDDAEALAAVAAALGEKKRTVAIVETAAGVWNVLAIARAPGVERLAFGALDLQLDAGIRGEGEELAYARSRLVLASKVAGLAPPIDSVTTSIDDERKVAQDAERGRRFGFGGKLCIHPRQVPVVNRAWAVTAEEADWAQGLLEALGARKATEPAAFSYRGGMVDRPVIERARELVALVRQQGEDPRP